MRRVASQILSERFEPVARITEHDQARFAFFEFGHQRAEICQWSARHGFVVNLHATGVDEELANRCFRQAAPPANWPGVVRDYQLSCAPIHAATSVNGQQTETHRRQPGHSKPSQEQDEEPVSEVTVAGRDALQGFDETLQRDRNEQQAERDGNQSEPTKFPDGTRGQKITDVMASAFDTDFGSGRQYMRWETVPEFFFTKEIFLEQLP